jgi:hypothetical protein
MRVSLDNCGGPLSYTLDLPEFFKQELPLSTLHSKVAPATLWDHRSTRCALSCSRSSCLFVATVLKKVVHTHLTYMALTIPIMIMLLVLTKAVQ